MQSRVVVSWVFGVVAVGLMGGGCDVLQGLQPATLSESTGGTGGSAGTTSSTSGGTGGTSSVGGTSSTGGTEPTPCEPGTSIDCYTGIPATSNGKADCHGGVRHCKADGSDYEDVCEGEHIPQPETCGSTEDEDCDGLDCARWANVYGDGSEQKPLDVKVDGSGNAYVLGAFKGAIKFGSAPQVSAGQFDLFLVKLDPSGKVLWDKYFGDAADQQEGQIAVDASGGVAVAGKLTGTLDFGGGNVQGKDLFVAKLDADGGHVWSKALTAGAVTSPRIAAGFGGSVVLWTSFLGAADFGDGSLTANPDRKAVLTSLDGTTGSPSWLRAFVSTGGQGPYHTLAASIAADGSGNITFNGGFWGAKLNLGGADLLEPALNGGGAFLARFDKLGTHAWSVASSSTEAVYGEMGVDSVGAVVLASVDDSDGFAPCTSAFIAKRSNVGISTWLKSFNCVDQGPAYDFKSIAFATDAQENVVIALVPPDDTFDFGSKPLSGNGGRDIVLGKLDSDGSHMWSRRFGDAADQRDALVAVAPNGDIVMAAQVSGTIDVGTGPLATNGQDLLIARFAP